MNAPISDSTAMNFSWLEQDRIAGCRGPRTDAELRFLGSVVRALVRLAPEDESGILRSDVKRHGLADCYEPMDDWTAPSQKQIGRVLTFVARALADGKAVAVSCGAGYGRTGTVLACYLVSKGIPAEAALEKLIAVRPCSREVLQVPGQKQAVLEFGERLQRSRGAV